MGRIGLDWYRKDPKVVFAIVDSEKGGFGPPGSGSGNVYMGIMSEGEDPAGAKLSEVVRTAPPIKAGFKAGDVVVSFGEKPTPKYADLVEQLRQRKIGDKVKAKVKRAGKDVEIEVTLASRPTGPDKGSRGQCWSTRIAGSAACSAVRSRTRRTARDRTRSSTAASTSRPTAATPGPASTASTPGRCTSARSASTRVMRRICMC